MNETINVILSYRDSPLKSELKRCGGIKLTVIKKELWKWLKEVKEQGFNEVLYYKWMDEQEGWGTK